MAVGGELPVVLAGRLEHPRPQQRHERGWYCLGAACGYRGTGPRRLDIFSTRLVVYEGEDRLLHILDGWCPHMGAELAKGIVAGNSILCPIHGWSWNADGVCEQIPHCRRIPLRANLKSWPVSEQDGMLFVWNDPDDAPPAFPASIASSVMHARVAG